jgi:acyl-CoA thioester hydrolase
MAIEFEAAAHIDDLLTVRTEAVAATGARLTLAQEIWRDQARLVSARLVVVAVKGGRPARLPAAIARLML